MRENIAGLSESISMKIFRKNLCLEITCSLLISFTIFFFGPLEIFLSEPAEFWFSVSDVIILVISSTLLCFFITLAIQFVFSLLGNKISLICSSLFASTGLALYLQGNWTFVNYGQMDGTAINWSEYSNWAVINTIGWILILIIITFFVSSKKKNATICSYVMLGIVGIEILTLGTLCISSIGTESKAKFTLTGGDEFQLSSNHNNIIIILADGFDGSNFLPVLEAEPGFKQYFDGFTFYEDTCGTSLYSEESGITLLTGNQFEVGLSFNENVKQAYLNTNLYNLLEENNYDTYLYLDFENMVSPEISEQIVNFSNTQPKISNYSVAFKEIYKMVFFKYVPHNFKKHFWYTSTNFSALKENASNKRCLYYNYDVFDLIQSQGVLAQETSHNIYQFYWIQGPHEPANTDRYCQKIEHVIKMESDEYSHGQFEQTIGVVRMYTELIGALKEAGVYDNTTVIFTADHGWDIRPNPCLLIKPANSHGELNISKVPVSMVTDYLPTLEYFITGNKNYNNTIYDLEEDMDRDRIFYVYDINNSDRTYNSKTEFYYKTGAFSSKVKLGEKLLPYQINCFVDSGFSSTENTHIWTDGTESVLKFKLDEKFNNLQLDMNYCTYNGIQPVKIYANNILITQYEANGEEEKSIIIPGDYVKDNELILKFEFMNAISPIDVNPNNTDSRKLALSFYSLMLSNTDKQTNQP